MLRNKKTILWLLLPILFASFAYRDQTMSIYRRTVWFIKGMREYTKSGYEAAAKNFKEEDLKVDCSGKSYMITGSNSGIGKSMALEVAKRGGTVHLVCRNKTAAQEACDEIKTSTGNNNVHVHVLDVSKPRDVINFARSFNENLDVLVNNAGCMVHTREVDADGLERNFATNVLGTFLLTKALLTRLEQSSDPRVVTVSSGGMLNLKLDPEDPQCAKMNPFEGTMVYSQNKRGQVVMTEHLARAHPAVHFSSMHPGWADTPAVRTSMPSFHNAMKNKLRSPEQGADTAVWLAISPAARKQPSGLFFQDRVAVSTHLPLAWTKSTPEEEKAFMQTLDDFWHKFNRSD
ncbi:dehydrogenase/reductase SDR family member 12-like [Neocloeon triangulifer]|uniref:dehydrogenase/reductase SDR family member 12-like n=1 Tax=Neocloeon triangulifer TaxID=2078957 RepID=UPI00286F7A25|nr:dehydrogenase/reductase SDR family member 12-like [Neocloeon triangulifer]